LIPKIKDENDDDWDEYTDGALFTLNTHKLNTTKYSPFFLMYGRHPRSPLKVGKVVEDFDEDQGKLIH